jgi:hypothetical protein
MTKADVVRVLGNPVSTAGFDGTEVLRYELSTTKQIWWTGGWDEYFVKLVNGRVVSYGKRGDVAEASTVPAAGHATQSAPYHGAASHDQERADPCGVAYLSNTMATFAIVSGGGSQEFRKQLEHEYGADLWSRQLSDIGALIHPDLEQQGSIPTIAFRCEGHRLVCLAKPPAGSTAGDYGLGKLCAGQCAEANA